MASAKNSAVTTIKIMSNMFLVSSNQPRRKYGDSVLHPTSAPHSEGISCRGSSKFHKNRQVDPIFDFLQIGRKTGHEGSRRSANILDDRSSGAGRRCNSSRSRKIWSVGSAVIELRPECNVLAGHPIKCSRSVPSFELVPWIFRKVGRARSCRCAVDRRQQHEVAPRIVDLAATQRQTVVVVAEPEAVIEHEAEKTLLRALRRVAPAADTASVFATDIAGQRESRFAQKILWSVQILDFNAVIAVVTHASRNTQGLFTDAILVSEDRQPAGRPPQNLHP